jgi:hypothetical protein
MGSAQADVISLTHRFNTITGCCMQVGVSVLEVVTGRPAQGAAVNVNTSSGGGSGGGSKKKGKKQQQTNRRSTGSGSKAPVTLLVELSSQLRQLQGTTPCGGLERMLDPVLGKEEGGVHVQVEVRASSVPTASFSSLFAFLFFPIRCYPNHCMRLLLLLLLLRLVSSSA